MFNFLKRHQEEAQELADLIESLNEQIKIKYTTIANLNDNADNANAIIKSLNHDIESKKQDHFLQEVELDRANVKLEECIKAHDAKTKELEELVEFEKDMHKRIGELHEDKIAKIAEVAKERAQLTNILRTKITAEREYELHKNNISTAQSECNHPDEHRRELVHSPLNPGKHQVICIKCGLIRTFNIR